MWEGEFPSFYGRAWQPSKGMVQTENRMAVHTDSMKRQDGDENTAIITDLRTVILIVSRLSGLAVFQHHPSQTYFLYTALVSNLAYQVNETT